jgi:hypothetical protein
MSTPTDKKAALAQLGIEETTTEATGTDVYMSLVRFERLAVVKWFDHPVEWLMENHGEMEGTAALVFVHMRREGKTDRDAFGTVANMTNGQILSYFAAEDSDDQAETPAGKGGSSETSSPTSSPTTEPDSALPTDWPRASTTD